MTIKKLIIGLLGLFGLFFIFTYFPFGRSTETASSTAPVTEPSLVFSQTDIKANAAYIVDLTSNQVIFNKNADVPLPLASLTKLMTVLVANQILLPDEIVNVSPESLAIEGESGLVPNEKWKFKDLADFTLLVSSNDGANALALAAASRIKPDETSTTTLQHIFVDEMNRKSQTLGFNSFHFENETGLDIDKATPSATGSAADVSRLLEYLLKNYPTLLEVTKHSTFNFTSLNGTTHQVKNTDLALSKVSYIVASKTGFTELAGGNLSVVYNVGLNHPIIITVLGSTGEDRFEDIISLASSTAAYILGG